MTPKRKVSELYNSAYELYPTPTNIEELAETNRKIAELNITVCRIMESMELPYLWRKTRELIQSQINKL